MPREKRSAWVKLPNPENLDPNEEVFVIRFTGEIFRDYGEYLKRMAWYRERIWTCRLTGKVNLTFEEALASELKAKEDTQSFPREFIGPVLRAVQFSPLCVSELVDRVHKRYKDHFVEGESFDGVSDGGVSPCRILKVMEESDECDSERCSCSYDVAWLKNDGSIRQQSTESVRSLKRKKHPLTKTLLKTFIRESATAGNTKKSRWFVLDELARQYNLPLELSEDEADSAEGSNENKSNGHSRSKRKEFDGKTENGKTQKKKKITDIVPVSVDDELLPEPSEESENRPVPHSSFLVPPADVGNLLMVWSFCRSFSEALRLTPFSLEDFQRALLYVDDECNLLAEVHHALLKHVLENNNIKDKLLKEKKGKRKRKMSLETWPDDLADLLETCTPKLISYGAPIRHGEYADLDTGTKLDILRELVENCIRSAAIRGQIEKHIPKRSDSKKKQLADDQVDEAEAVDEDDDENDEPPPIAEHIDGTNGMVKSFKRKKKALTAVDKKKEKEEADRKKCPLRNIFLGNDRSQNRYWFFPREGRLFIESSDSSRWSFYSTREEFDGFYKSLNTRGTREKALKEQLDQHYDAISESFEEEEEDSEEFGGKRYGHQVPSFLRYKNMIRIEDED